jgi:hypothetical protein
LESKVRSFHPPNPFDQSSKTLGEDFENHHYCLLKRDGIIGVAVEDSMKPFTITTLAVLALTVAGFFAVRDLTLGFIGLLGLGALWLDFARVRKDTVTKLEFPAFSLASLAVMALFIQGFFAVAELAMGMTGLIGLISICMDLALLRACRLEPIRTFSLPAMALIAMVLGGVFNVSELVIGYSGLIGLVALVFDVSHKTDGSQKADVHLPLSDLEMIRQDVQKAG